MRGHGAVLSLSAGPEHGRWPSPGMEEVSRAGPQGHTCRVSGGLSRNSHHGVTLFAIDFTLLPPELLLSSQSADSFLHFCRQGCNGLYKNCETPNTQQEAYRVCSLESHLQNSVHRASPKDPILPKGEVAANLPTPTCVEVAGVIHR